MKEYPYVWHGFGIRSARREGRGTQMLRWYLAQSGSYLRTLLLPLGMSALSLLLVPIWFPISELSASLSAIPLERLVSLLGIFLLAPAFCLGKPKCSTGEKPPHLVAESLLRDCLVLLWISWMDWIFCLGMEQSGCQIQYSALGRDTGGCLFPRGSWNLGWYHRRQSDHWLRDSQSLLFAQHDFGRELFWQV